VVVLVTDDNAAFLEECVGSIRDRSGAANEVVVVARGNARETTAVVNRVVASHRRVRRLDLPGASWPVAVSAGARSSTGELLMLCDAGDLLVPGALGAMVTDLDQQPSVEVVGGTRSGLGRVLLSDLMVRRSWWERAGVEVSGAPHGDWSAAATLVLGAQRALPGPGRVRTGPRRGSGAAFATMPVRAPWVADWWPAVVDVLEALADGPGREHFLRWLLDEEAPTYLDDTERCNPKQWRELGRAARRLLELSPPGLVGEIRVESRVRLWLAAHGHRQELEVFSAIRWLDEGQFSTSVEDGQVYAELPLDDGLVPRSVLALGDAESALDSVLRGMRWVGPAVLELEILAFVHHLSWDVRPASHQVRVVAADGRRTLLASTRESSPQANVVSGDRFADHSSGVLLARWEVSEALSDALLGEHWQVEVELDLAGVVRRGGLTDVDLRGSASDLGPDGPGPGHGITLCPRRMPDGGWTLVATAAHPPEPGWQVTDVALDGDEMTVRGDAGTGTARLELRGRSSTSAVDVRVVGSRFESRLRLAHDPWQLGRGPLPAGTYRLHLTGPGMASRRVPMATGLAARTPSWQLSDTYRLRLQRALDGTVLVTLAAPLLDDEVGPLAQQGLQRWYASDEHRIDPGIVFLQSFTGESATDTPLAIHHELRRRRPDLALVWSVADRSTTVPEGGEGVLLRSREWYAALATAGHIVTNIDMDRWFAKRPGQRLLQSFHGYPSKTMGIAAWEAKNFTPRRIERQLARTSGTWDLLLTPAPAMDVHYRREYLYDGEILAAGYPRDDALTGSAAERTREQTRQRLGIAAGQRAVLYAPTWRDDLATNFRAAAMSTSFDVKRAATELGDDHVVLLRGHRFHRQREAGGSRLLDVTHYPEINDLVLAADVAVLDYSSLRFDFALTKRPMVFLVPDLDRYTGGVRGFLFDFRGSAPGPLLGTTDEVVTAILDLEGLRERHRDDLVRFNEEFNACQDGHAAERAVRAFFGPGPGSTD